MIGITSVRLWITSRNNVDDEEISASFEDGVLEITLPKRAEEENRARRIEIASSGDGSKSIEGDIAEDAGSSDESSDETSSQKG